MMTDLNAELREAVEELVGHVEATAHHCVWCYYDLNGVHARDQWQVDVHGVTPDVQTIEAAADRVEQRLGE